jgi:HSP20 family protein
METTASPKVSLRERPLDWSVIETAGENVLDRFREDLRDLGADLELFQGRMGSWMRPPITRLLPLPSKMGVMAPLDIEDKGTSYEVRMNLPGIPKELVGIKFLDQTLEIEAATKATKETERKNYVLRERLESEYHRRVSFPSPVAPEKSEAKLDHGVLVVSVPKLKPAKELRIPLT